MGITGGGGGGEPVLSLPPLLLGFDLGSVNIKKPDSPVFEWSKWTKFVS
jgi:hypothetical protein